MCFVDGNHLGFCVICIKMSQIIEELTWKAEYKPEKKEEQNNNVGLVRLTELRFNFLKIN